MEPNAARDTQKSTKLWNLNFIILFGINLLSNFSFHLVTPLLSKYAINLGASVSMAGLIVGIFAITALFIGPFGGILTDRTNKKYVMIISTIINGIATLGYSLAPSVWVIIFFRVLHGASFSMTLASSLAWIADFIPAKKMGEGIGHFGLGQIIATAFGPQIGIMTSSGFGISKTYMVAAILLILAAIGMNFVSDKVQKTLQSIEVKKSRIRLKDIIALEILPLSLIGGLFSMGNGLVSSFLVLLGEQRNISGVGLYFTVNAIFLLLIRPIAGKLYDKKGLSIILYPALIFGCMESLFLGHASALWMIILAAVVKAFGQGTAQPALQAESLRKLGSQRSGVASSTFYIGGHIGQGVGPLLGGTIASTFGYNGMFNFSAMLMLCGIFSYAVYNKRISTEIRDR